MNPISEKIEKYLTELTEKDLKSTRLDHFSKDSVIIKTNPETNKVFSVSYDDGRPHSSHHNLQGKSIEDAKKHMARQGWNE